LSVASGAVYRLTSALFCGLMSCQVINLRINLKSSECEGLPQTSPLCKIAN
jgi:hypothetical protein